MKFLGILEIAYILNIQKMITDLKDSLYQYGYSPVESNINEDTVWYEKVSDDYISWMLEEDKKLLSEDVKDKIVISETDIQNSESYIDRDGTEIFSVSHWEYTHFVNRNGEYSRLFPYPVRWRKEAIAITDNYVKIDLQEWIEFTTYFIDKSTGKVFKENQEAMGVIQTFKNQAQNAVTHWV